MFSLQIIKRPFFNLKKQSRFSPFLVRLQVLRYGYKDSATSDLYLKLEILHFAYQNKITLQLALSTCFLLSWLYLFFKSMQSAIAKPKILFLPIKPPADFLGMP